MGRLSMRGMREQDQRDASKWRFCIEHGFPRCSFDPETSTTYWYILDFCPYPECLKWTTPVHAVEYAMKVTDSRSAG